MSVKHWGEVPVGNWTLSVRNAYLPKHHGVLKAWQLTVFGESTEPSSMPSVLPSPVVTPSPGDKKPVPGDDKSQDNAGVKGVIGALFVPLLLVLGSGALSALAMLVYMRRRERKLASMRWTALDAIGDSNGGSEEGEFRRHPQLPPRPEDDEDTDIYDIVQTITSLSPSNRRNGAYKHLPSGDEIVVLADGDGADDDLRTMGNSSKGSAESENLV
ncbi:hypothetical protein IWW38_005579 [Coemansia aciculifera]|uniref:Uncharacterized protein n=1 Tax=Coemansia aciculifera TaxID=417176 RepID=A0ACC1LW52_9FUNG|nr:hypothetical protein IWW38_005579 [Coemansia aciculifera]